MKNKAWFALIYVGLLAWTGLCADYFVAQNGQSSTWPHTNWSMAASNIQDAVNAATNGALVLVDAGVYRVPTNAFINVNSTNVVYITNAVTLRGIAGAAATIIDGGGSNRCVYLYMDAAACAAGPFILDGFTVTNGYCQSSGAGVVITVGATVGTAMVQNCVISGNTVQKNVVATYPGGGGIYAYTSFLIPVISNCTVRGNRTIIGSEGASSGGGLWFRAAARIVDCVFDGNTASEYGGAMYLRAPQSLVDRCMIVSNAASSSGGGIYMRGDGLELRNSLLIDNTAPSGAGLFAYSSGSLPVYNCTFAGSRFQVGSSVNNGDMQNNIIDNMVLNADAVITGYNNCLPAAPGVGIWHNTLVTTNNPAYIGFVDAANGDYRLLKWSPCVNAGINQLDWLAGAMDLYRRRRLDAFSHQVDMGCYEYTPRGALYHVR